MPNGDPRDGFFYPTLTLMINSDYDKYRDELSEASLPLKIQTNNNIDQNIQGISETILNAADKTIPNKLVTIKSNDSPWITCHTKYLDRKRERIFRNLKKTYLTDSLLDEIKNHAK